MVILDGDESGLMDCRRIIVCDPCHKHAREFEDITGLRADMRYLVDDNIDKSGIIAYAAGADKDGKEFGFMSGVYFYGITTFPVWMAASEDAHKHPVWLWRNSLRILRLFKKHIGRGFRLRQKIPDNYREGLNYVRHLGFKTVGVGASPATGIMVHTVELEID